MKTDFSGMQTEIKIWNFDELLEKQKDAIMLKDIRQIEESIIALNALTTKNKDFKGYFKDSEKITNKYNELLDRFLRKSKRKELTPATSEIEDLKKQIKKLEEELSKGLKFDPYLRVIKYFCEECDFSSKTTRLFYRCPRCSGKLKAFYLFDKKGKKLEEPEEAEFTECILSNTEIKIKEDYKPIKIKEEKPMKETRILICGNRNCGAYGVRKELQHTQPNEEIKFGDLKCRFCGHTNYISK